MALTELAVKKTQKAERDYKIGDGNGLWLKVTKTGSKLWHFRFTYAGNESVISLGSFPATGLREARERALESRRLLSQGINPSAKRKEEKRKARFNSDNTFKAVAQEWHTASINKWTPYTARKLWRRLEIHILPELGNRPIAEISSLELLDTLRRIEKNNQLETTHRALQTCRSVFRYGVLTQKLAYNPAHDLSGALRSHKTVSYPTIGHNQIPEFLERLESVKTRTLTRLAVKMLMLTFVRQGELRRAKWSDFDFKTNEWRVRPETTKMRTIHHVPISKQTSAILEEIRKITGDSEYVFANQARQRHPYMSENTINKVIHNMGYKGVIVGHGFRSLASTILNENGFRADVIERQLAHMPRDQVRAVYNRAEYLPERRQMMQWWGDFLGQMGLK